LADAHVKAVDFLMKKQEGILENVNIGTGKGTSVKEIIETFIQEIGLDLNWKFGPRRDGDVIEIFANAEKAEKLLGWKAELTIKDALQDAWNWEKHLAEAQ
jgi:UDP-glucose 4-epimerase